MVCTSQYQHQHSVASAPAWRACPCAQLSAGTCRRAARCARLACSTPAPAPTCPVPRPPLQLIDWALLPRALLGVLALLCGNGYIVGINQIYDVDIDAVNKPFLPVAAGELSQGTAWLLCLALAAGEPRMRTPPQRAS